MELLQQVRIIDPVRQIDRLADVSIVRGKIAQIDDRINNYPAETAIVEPSGLVLGTGLVDLYSHSGEPGNETRETLLELAQAGAAGGFTQIGILADTIPAIDRVEVVAAMKRRSDFSAIARQNDNLPQLNFWGAAWDLTTQQMNALGELESEVIGFTSSHHLGNINVLKQILEYLQPWSNTIAIDLHQNELGANGVTREGAVSIRYGMVGTPGYSEAAVLAAVLEMVAEIPANIHIMRVSTKRGVELIADAKARGINVTASTTWMHLLWDSKSVGSYDPNLRLEPPLGSESDRQALADGVRQGTIDAIAIDHQAYTYEEKTVAFALAPTGVIGLELALPLLWQRFVATGKWSAIELWQALSSRPRQCIGQQPAEIASQQSADLVLFAPDRVWNANRNSLKSSAANSPWYEREITGKVIETWTSSA